MFFLLLSTAPLLSALQFPAALLHRPHCPTTSAPHALCSLFPTRDPKLIPSLISPPPLLGATAAAGWFVPTGHPPDGAGRGASVLARHGKTSSNHGKISSEVQRGEEWQGDTSNGSTRAVTVTKEGEGESSRPRSRKRRPRERGGWARRRGGGGLGRGPGQRWSWGQAAADREPCLLVCYGCESMSLLGLCWRGARA